MGTSVSKTSRAALKKSCPIGEDPKLDIKIIKAHLEWISKEIRKDNSLKKNLMESVRVLDNEIQLMKIMKMRKKNWKIILSKKQRI